MHSDQFNNTENSIRYICMWQLLKPVMWALNLFLMFVCQLWTLIGKIQAVLFEEHGIFSMWILSPGAIALSVKRSSENKTEENEGFHQP